MALGLLAFVVYALFHFLPFPSFWWSTACIVLLFAGGIWQAERLQKNVLQGRDDSGRTTCTHRLAERHPSRLCEWG